MEVQRVDSHGGTPWIQAVYQSQSLGQRHGRGPENVVVRQLTEALDALGVDHEIYYDLDMPALASQHPLCDAPSASVARPSLGIGGVDVGRGIVSDPLGGPRTSSGHAMPHFEDFIENDAPVVAADSNLCLLDAEGGGCAAIAGNVGVAGVRAIDHDPGSYVGYGDDDWAGQVSAALHEIGHNMGNTHPDHGGWAWNGPTHWHRTPYGPDHDPSGQEAENRCGEQIESKQRDPIMQELYYHSCQADHMHIRDKPPLDGGGGQGPPMADFVVDQQDLSVWADASPSSGGGGSIDAYEWDWGDGSQSFGVNASHTYTDGGTYTVTLAVGGTTGHDSATGTVTVQDPGPDPDPDPDPAVSEFHIVNVDGLTVELDGSMSHGGGGIELYEWQLDDGSIIYGPTQTYTYGAPGTYSVSLYVRGADGSNDFTQEPLTVERSDGDAGTGGGIDIGTGEVVAAGGLFTLLLLARPENRPEEIFGD